MPFSCFAVAGCDAASQKCAATMATHVRRLDGMRRDVPTPHSLLLTNFIGPPGLLLHAATSLLVGKGLPLLDGSGGGSSKSDDGSGARSGP